MGQLGAAMLGGRRAVVVGRGLLYAIAANNVTANLHVVRTKVCAAAAESLVGHGNLQQPVGG